MDNSLALLGAFLTGLVSLVVSLGKIILDIQKERRDGIKASAEKSQIEATATQTLSEASAVIAKEYINLLDKVKTDFNTTLEELKKEIESLRSELEKEKKNSIMKDQTILNLEKENKNLNKRVEELEIELKAWKLSSGNGI